VLFQASDVAAIYNERLAIVFGFITLAFFKVWFSPAGFVSPGLAVWV
jgi:hypothetical protein